MKPETLFVIPVFGPCLAIARRLRAKIPESLRSRYFATLACLAAGKQENRDDRVGTQCLLKEIK